MKAGQVRFLLVVLGCAALISIPIGLTIDRIIKIKRIRENNNAELEHLINLGNQEANK